MRVHPHPNQAALAKVARRVLRLGLAVRGVPSVAPAGHEVALRYAGPADLEAMAAAQVTFRTLIGWGLVQHVLATSPLNR